MTGPWSRMVMAATLLAMCGSAMAFSISGPVVGLVVRHRAIVTSRTTASAFPLRRGTSERVALRMADAPGMGDVEEDKEEEAPVSSTVMSDEDLDARIAALGLKAGEAVEDRSTGEGPALKPIERAQKMSVDVGKAAIGTAASGMISVLNAFEKPISEEEWQKIQEEKKKNGEESGGLYKPKDDENIIQAGGLVVVIPVLLVGGALAYWAVASELNLF